MLKNSYVTKRTFNLEVLLPIQQTCLICFRKTKHFAELLFI